MPDLTARSHVAAAPAAPAAEARAHFAGLLAFETDCWDVHADLEIARAAASGETARAAESGETARAAESGETARAAESGETARPPFVLLDVRSPDLFATGHVPGAVNLPHGRIVERNLVEWPADTLFVVYCAGPHCNGADKAALRLADLGRPVKKMIGGITGWLDEGFTLARHAAPG